MVGTPAVSRRTLGVHLSLDADTLEKLDAEASRSGLSRSALVRSLVSELAAQAEEDRWLLERSEAALADPANRKRIPWAQVKREMGL
jgi:hypothetical protein